MTFTTREPIWPNSFHFVRHSLRLRLITAASPARLAGSDSAKGAATAKRTAAQLRRYQRNQRKHLVTRKRKIADDQ
jgi:hypothetical protein